MMEEYNLEMFLYNGELFVVFRAKHQIEYIVPLSVLVETLEEHDEKEFFLGVDEIDTKIDPNPRFITNIPVIDNNIIRIKK